MLSSQFPTSMSRLSSFFTSKRRRQRKDEGEPANYAAGSPFTEAERARLDGFFEENNNYSPTKAAKGLGYTDAPKEVWMPSPSRSFAPTRVRCWGATP